MRPDGAASRRSVAQRAAFVVAVLLIVALSAFLVFGDRPDPGLELSIGNVYLSAAAKRSAGATAGLDVVRCDEGDGGAARCTLSERGCGSGACRVAVYRMSRDSGCWAARLVRVSRATFAPGRLHGCTR